MPTKTSKGAKNAKDRKSGNDPKDGPKARNAKREAARLRREVKELRKEMRRDMWKLRLRVDRIASIVESLRTSLAGAVLHGMKLMLGKEERKAEEKEA